MKIPPSPSTVGRQSWTGSVSENLVQYRLNRFGFPTVMAGGQLAHDLVTEVHGQYYSVQVKGAVMMAKPTPGCKDVHRFQITQGKLKENYKAGAIDIFAFVASDLEMVHFIPADFVPKQQTFRLDSRLFNVNDQENSLDYTLTYLMSLRSPR